MTRMRIRATAAAALLLACGGGETAIVGVGNSGNRITPDHLEKVAEALAELSPTPEVTDEMILRIFQGLLTRAESGDPDAAMVVLGVAEEQRKKREEP